MNENENKIKWRRVATVISEEASEKLDAICLELEGTMPWVLSRLILESDIDRLREKREGGGL